VKDGRLAGGRLPSLDARYLSQGDEQTAPRTC
jgi:hypothetical protein